MATVKDYQNYTFSTGTVAGEDYRKFERLCKSELTKMCKPFGISLYKFHKMHYEFSAILERNGKYIYVSISDVRYFLNWYDRVLIRTMKHERDWTGGINNFVVWNEIGEMADRLLQE